MKKVATIAAILFAAALAVPRAHAQAAPAPAPAETPRQSALKQQFALKQTQASLLEEKLHGITEFQQYLQLQREMSQLSQQYTAAQPPAPKPPAVAKASAPAPAPSAKETPPK